MVSLKGMIIRCSSIIPEIREAIFRCLVCGYYSDPIVVDRGRINEPMICGKQECLARNSMTLVHNRCRFADKQIVRLQETPDEIPEGGTPHTVSLLMHDKLVDSGKPGDRVEFSGICCKWKLQVSSGVFLLHSEEIGRRNGGGNVLKRERYEVFAGFSLAWLP